jgi:hypothetical protein
LLTPKSRTARREKTFRRAARAFAPIAMDGTERA